MTSAPTSSQPLRILMSACVPRRREGGVATIIYHLGEELEKRGHSVTYVFQEDLFGQGKMPQRFLDIAFARRLNRINQSAYARTGVIRKQFPPTGAATGRCALLLP